MLTPEIARALSLPDHRADGPLKVSGRAQYAADVHLPGMLWAKFLGSPVPHARIVSIDTRAAKAMPGVHAVLTGQDIGRVRFGRRLQDWPVLAWERVRFIGDRVAAVAAETPDIAEAALQAIQVEYEELPAVFEPEAALADGAPILHETAAEYRYLGAERPSVPHPNLQGYLVRQKGDADLERAFAQAERVFEHTFTTPRFHAGYLEPHATLVWLDEEQTVHILTTNKAPFLFREEFSAAVGLPQERVVVHTRFIGGDFGAKGLVIDEHACFYLALATGRPVKAVMTYADELQATNVRHATRMRLRTGVGADGRFVAHQAEVVHDGGAYAAPKVNPDVGLPGPRNFYAYNIPHVRMELKTVYTNTVPGGVLRSPGYMQLAFAWESHVDLIAREIGMDPLEMRLRNAVREGDTGPIGQYFTPPSCAEVLETLRRETRWGERPLPPGHGRGVAFFSRQTGAGNTSLILRLRPDGMIEVLTGVPDQGAGAHTMMRRVAAAVLSVDPGDIVVTVGDTATAPWDPGVEASRVTHLSGRATVDGAVRLKQTLEELAAEVMGWPAGRVCLVDGRFVSDAEPGGTAPFAEVARRIARVAPVEVTGAYQSRDWGPGNPADLNFAAYVVEVSVDQETGQITIHDVVFVADVGTIINPIALQGQIEGEFVFGIGEAVTEDMRLEHGRVTTVHLGDYKLPTAGDVPPLRILPITSYPGPGPFGAKQVGELSSLGVPPAIANAVYDAVGVRITELPITAERVWSALRGQP